MFKVFAYLTKREGSTREEFIDYYENHHVPLVLSLAPMPTVYKRNYLRQSDPANLESPAIGFDVVTEMALAPPMFLPRLRADSWPSRVRSRMYSRSIPDSAASTVNTTSEGSCEPWNSPATAYETR